MDQIQWRVGGREANGWPRRRRRAAHVALEWRFTLIAQMAKIPEAPTVDEEKRRLEYTRGGSVRRPPPPSPATPTPQPPLVNDSVEQQRQTH